MHTAKCSDLSGQNLTGQLPDSITRLRVLNTMCAHAVLMSCRLQAVLWVLYSIFEGGHRGSLRPRSTRAY
jgi:hypothetical protein